MAHSPRPHMWLCQSRPGVAPNLQLSKERPKDLSASGQDWALTPLSGFEALPLGSAPGPLPNEEGSSPSSRQVSAG